MDDERKRFIPMSLVTNQSVFLVNQELLTLLATQPSLHANFDYFCVSRRCLASRHFSLDCCDSSSPSSPPRSYGARSSYASPDHFKQLAAVISSAFPDFDFSSASQTDFKLIPSPELAQTSIFWAFHAYVPDCARFLALMWSVLDKEIGLRTCAIYQYDPDHPDGFSESGVVTNFNYLFLNDRANRCILVHLSEGGVDFDAESDAEEMDGCIGYAVF
jgi:hypothetical protein